MPGQRAADKLMATCGEWHLENDRWVEAFLAGAMDGRFVRLRTNIPGLPIAVLL
jgi:hypothetical protein